MTKAEAIEYLRLPLDREYDGEHVIKVAGFVKRAEAGKDAEAWRAACARLLAPLMR